MGGAGREGTEWVYSGKIPGVTVMGAGLAAGRAGEEVATALWWWQMRRGAVWRLMDEQTEGGDKDDTRPGVFTK